MIAGLIHPDRDSSTYTVLVTPYANAYLREAIADTDLATDHRLHALCALAELGDPRPNQIVVLVEHARTGECKNIVSALSKSLNHHYKRLHRRLAWPATKQTGG
jgi:hypothetical protein